jgi:hypothetical protein
VLREEDLSGPRGPDARYKVVVPADWLREESWIEIVLPRTLSCALCDGGGCDTCGRSGAVDTRKRKEIPEVLEVRLPPTETGATMRLPKRGGLPLEDEDTVTCRGILLLTVTPGDAASEGVTRREPVPEVPAPEETTLARLSRQSLLPAAVLAKIEPRARGRIVAIGIAAAVVLLAAGTYLLLR